MRFSFKSKSIHINWHLIFLSLEFMLFSFEYKKNNLLYNRLFLIKIYLNNTALPNKQLAKRLKIWRKFIYSKVLLLKLCLFDQKYSNKSFLLILNNEMQNTIPINIVLICVIKNKHRTWKYFTSYCAAILIKTRF